MSTQFIKDNLLPELGMGATLNSGVNSFPSTIVLLRKTKSGKVNKIGIRFDTTNFDSVTGKHTFSPTTGEVHFYTLRRNGRWVEVGDKQNQFCLTLGERKYHIDSDG